MTRPPGAADPTALSEILKRNKALLERHKVLFEKTRQKLAAMAIERPELREHLRNWERGLEAARASSLKQRLLTQPASLVGTPLVGLKEKL